MQNNFKYINLSWAVVGIVKSFLSVKCQTNVRKEIRLSGINDSTFALKKTKHMRHLILLSLLAIGMIVQAQEVKEGGTLKEVTIQGSKVVQRVDGQTIYPTRQQLESSTNGYSLLSKLALPHLRVDPVMHIITALSNLGSVQVRINDIVASKEDLLALDMKAVKHIDYIDNPGVRYGEGIAYVVNIIVKKPLSGYDIGADFTNTLTAVNGDETVFGKFNRGKSEFGVNYSLNHNVQLTYSLSDSNYVFQSKLSARRDIQPHRSWTKFKTYENLSTSRTSSPVLDLYFHRDFRGNQSLTANAVGTYIKTDSYAEHNEGGSEGKDILTLDGSHL